MIFNKSLIAISSILLTAAVLAAVTGCYSLGTTVLVRDSGVWLVSVSVVGLSALVYLLRRGVSLDSSVTHLAVLSSILVLIFVYGSDYPNRNFVYPLVDNPLLTIPMIGAAILLLERFFTSTWAKKNLFSVSFFSPRLVLIFQLLLFVSFLSYADGQLIFSDDHPSFLYRLQMLVRNFPHIPFYNTDWNGGYSAQEFYPTGILNFFFLTFPLFYLSDIFSVDGAAVYTISFAAVFILLQPWLSYAAARLFGIGKACSSFAAILVLAPSLGFFEWLLKYGTISFALSCVLYPLVVALCWRVLFAEEEAKWRDTFLLVVAASLCVFWSGAFFMLLPLAVFGLAQPKLLFAKSRRACTIAFVVMFVAGLLLWLPSFIHYSSVFSFVSNTALPGVTAQKPSFWPTLEKLLSQRDKSIQGTIKVQPLLFVLFLPGLLALGSNRLRAMLAITIFWLFGLSLFGNAFKPQLELHRMIIPASFLLAVLSAAAIEAGYRFFLEKEGSRFNYLVGAALSFILLSYAVGSVMIAPYVAYAAYTNQTGEKYKFAPPELKTLSAAIKEHGGEGRTFFSGFILHELGTTSSASQDGGHIAPIATFSGKELYAFDYYHRRWSTVDPIPQVYRSRGHEGIEEFLDLINVTALVTYKPEWRDYCQKYPEIYQEVYQSDRFRLFTRRSKTDSFVMKGKGTVRRIATGIEFTPDPAAGAQEVILRYRYLPHLKVSPADAATIEPYFVFDDHKTVTELEPYNFIELKIKEGETNPIRIGF